MVLLAVAAGGVTTYYFRSYSRLIAVRLHGERERSLPRVYGRPVDLRRGQALSEPELVARLNELGYAQRTRADGPGQFAVVRNTVAIRTRGGPMEGRTIRVAFRIPAPVRQAGNVVTPPPAGIQDLQVTGGRTDVARLDPPILTDLAAAGARDKSRRVPLAAIPPHMRQAVIAIEDQRFYSHPGINPFALLATLVARAFGSNRPLTGGSTITQQLARMFFLADEFNAELQTGTRGRSLDSFTRKAQEMCMSLMLERRASKDEILEMYLNDVYLGQRGSFGIHGVAEASRIFFGKDVSNLTIAESALIAGVIQSPASRSPFTNPARAVERRDVVLRAMAGEHYITQQQYMRALREPLRVASRAVDSEAPYFVDMVGQQIEEEFPGLMTQAGRVELYTTLDLNLQRLALDAVTRGLAHVDALLAARRKSGIRNQGAGIRGQESGVGNREEPVQAALIAVDPRTGEILALVGGRSYNQSQYNRAVVARRQPGSVFKPFVYLAAFERAAAEGRTDFTPAALTDDSPGTIEFDGKTWEPRNYDDYDGEITWRRALAMSRNMGTIHVGEQVGFDRIAALWKKVGVGTPPQGVPSITLGVFELTPLEVAQAYTLFTNGGSVRPLHALDRIQTSARAIQPAAAPLRPVARPDTTFLVTNMMRSVLNDGTGAGARAAGFSLDAAGKSGTTNDLRDAWFVGFTPELLTVVWVGYDDNHPLGLSGSLAALPIWTEFMKGALAGHVNLMFEPPAGVTFAEIDRDTGKLAVPGCPHTITESFLAGTEPTEYCELHRQ